MAWDWSIQFQNPKRSWEFFFQHNGKWSDVPYIKAFIYFVCVCVCVCVCLFRAVLMALGGSQATGWTGGVEVGPQPQQCQIWAMSATYTIGHGNAGSLTHWVRPAIEPAFSWILVGFISTAPQWELQVCYFQFLSLNLSYSFLYYMCLLLSLMSYFISHFLDIFLYSHLVSFVGFHALKWFSG